MPLSQIEPYYRVGTATFVTGSDTVTFQAAGDLAANVQPGDQLFNRIGQKAPPVLTVVNGIGGAATVTLERPFRGTAQAADEYEIYRVSDSVRLENFSNQMVYLLKGNNLVSLGGQVLAANKGFHATGLGTIALHDQTPFIRTLLDDVDGPAARTTLDVAQKQSSAGDKTAGRGLIVGAYGMGSETAPGIGDCNVAVESGLYLVSAGANSPEAGGVLEVISRTASTKYQFFYGNSGQIYWRWWNGTVWASWASFSGIGGSNVNGDYYRLAGGLQFCISPTLAVDSTTAAGNIFRSAETTWTLPASFANGNFAVMPSGRGATTFWGAGRAASTSTAAYTVFTTASQTGRTVQLVAAGAW